MRSYVKREALRSTQKCNGININGKQCSRNVKSKEFCYQHREQKILKNNNLIKKQVSYNTTFKMS